ncbi:MAG: response regulator transcription factor [Bacteroidota bacterium]
MINAPLRCLVVEDEVLAAEIITDYIQEVPFLQLEKVLSDAISAMELLRKQKVDVIFLDIHLPRLKGLDFLRLLDQPPQVILTTAYPQYALESYDFGVVDYLLKPIDFPRFLQAVNRLERPAVAPSIQPEPVEQRDVILTVNKEKVRLQLNSIWYLEGMREYVALHTTEGRLVVKSSLKKMLELLGTDFVQIHKSYIVNQRHILALSATSVSLESQRLPIGRQFKDHVRNVLTDWQ